MAKKKNRSLSKGRKAKPKKRKVGIAKRRIQVGPNHLVMLKAHYSGSGIHKLVTIAQKKGKTRKIHWKRGACETSTLSDG